MRIYQPIAFPPPAETDWHKRHEGQDKGLISCWLIGIEKARQDPDLATRAQAGELPVLPWRGGVDKAIKRTDKVGALHYLAAWQGLRGEDLDIELGVEVHKTCTRTGVGVLFTDDISKLLRDGEAGSNDGLFSNSNTSAE